MRTRPDADPRGCVHPDMHPEIDVAGLLEEREHHLAALGTLDVGLLVLAPDLSVLLGNAAVERLFGGRPATLDDDRPGGSVVLREDGTDWPLLERPLIRAVLAGEPTRTAVMGLQRDGAVQWLRVTADPLRRPGEDRPYAALGTYTDITASLAAERSLRESEAHFRLLAENSTDVISRHAADGTCLYASPALHDMFGWQLADVVDRSPLERIHPDDVAQVVKGHSEVMHDGRPRSFRYRHLHRDGRWIWAESVVRPVRDASGRLHEMQLATRDVSSRMETEQRLSRLALADPLTGLANRAALIQQLEDLLATEAPLSVLFLDLDRFKVVNDSLGHSAGDELLRTVAGRLAGTCRDGDVVARLGGDEFVVVAQNLDEEAAVALAERVQHVLAAPVTVGGHELIVSASVGIVTGVRGLEGEVDAETVLRDADVSMYRAKAKGRARAVVWNEALGEAATERLALERDLRAGLLAGQLVVHYQPQVELESGRVDGVEALVRWQHPDRGLLLPTVFLEVADDTGLVVELGRQVLLEASRQVAGWRRLPGHGDLRLSVNLSAQELLRPGRAADLVDVLDDVGLPPAAVTVEVLESVLLDAEGDVRAALESYHGTGVALALDDFGTGYSSLLHLREVPVGVVKLDRVFVGGLGRSRQDEAIVRAVCSLTTELGLTCVAEGVEEPHQREWLVANGIALAQGFLLARPLPAEQVAALLVAGAPGRPVGG